MGMTLKQFAALELQAATEAYCNADKTEFVAASLRLHIARGGNVTRAMVRVSRALCASNIREF